MEIKKFKKNKDNSYTVIFDNELSLKLYDDVIVKYNLLVNKELDDEMLGEVTTYNDFLMGYYKAIKFIMKKFRSEKEVYEFLKKLEIKEDDIKKLIDKLRKDGYINVENYIKAYINDQLNLTLNGPDKIKNSLKKLGFFDNEIEDYLSNFIDKWDERIEKLIDKKIKTNNNLGKNRLKMKIVNDLINLGYQKYDIIKVLDLKELHDDNLIEKEYQKAYRKYSIKFKDKVDYRIKDYLFKKGFDINDIERVMSANE